jgi:polysaccharide biosynthesis protein PslG
MSKLWTAVAAICLLSAYSPAVQTNAASTFSGPGLSLVVPNSLGIQVHDVTDKNLDRAAQAGFKLIRTDLNWGEVEKAKGRYDWSYYDPIVNRLRARGQRPLFVVGYNNALYADEPNGQGDPYMEGLDTDRERQAFKNFAVAAVKRYQKLVNPIWEIHNEPNRPSFWSDPDPADYVNLIKVVAPAMRQANPAVYILGPAVGHAPDADSNDLIKVDFDYLEAACAQGVLNHVDAVSVHPYPDGDPELALRIYRDVRALINKYAPGKNLPIVSSEWGYSSVASFSGNEQTHANLLTRMYLINLSQQVTSIGYKLEEYSFDPSANSYEVEFGWFNKKTGQAKPVYGQVQTLIKTLNGMKFVKKLPAAEDEYLLEFSNGSKTIVAAWTSGSTHTISMYGKSIELSRKPVYISK